MLNANSTTKCRTATNCPIVGVRFPLLHYPCRSPEKRARKWSRSSGNPVRHNTPSPNFAPYEPFMRLPLRPSESRGWWMPYVLIAVPLVLLIVNCLRGAYCDIRMIRAAALKSEMSRLDSEARFHVSRIQTMVEVHDSADEPLAVMRDREWMKNFWSNLQKEKTNRLYVAITDPAGLVELHSNRSLEGQRLSHNWYDRRLPDAGPNVVYASTSPLAGAQPAYDLRVPIEIGERRIGSYHVGLSAEWLNGTVAGLEQRALVGWAWLLALATVANVAAVYGLMVLAGRHQALASQLTETIRSRARELAQLGGGLAHEMRNPLHALRINLHTLKRAIGKNTPLDRDQIAATVSDSDAVIDRLDVLLGDLVHYTEPATGETKDLNLAAEVQATLNLLAEDFRSRQVEVKTDLSRDPVQVRAEPTSFRHLLHNLLSFVQQTAGQSGPVEVQVQARNGFAELAIASAGLKLTDAERGKLFDPFQAPGESGSGLGLALVQSLLRNLGGSVSGESRAAGGTLLRLRLPLAAAPDLGVHP